ncbi:MAG: hypothetical protein LBH59_09420 [Planctomycetaceae bacterium]|jgi:hypothetical protein|nr:hypothetical protein [Planctomycetaceae bacterium]
MSTKKYFSLVIFLFVCSCFFQQLRADNITDIKDRLTKEAIPAWRAMKKNYENLTFTVVVNRDDIKKTNERDFAYSTLKLSTLDNNTMLECIYRDKEDGTVRENFKCKNKKYYFAIDRANREDQWQISELYLNENNNYDQINFDSYEIISTGWSILSVPMEDIINDPTFEIKSVATNKNKDNDELVTVTFTLLNNKLLQQQPIFDELQTATVVFNKTKNWIITNYELSSYNKNYEYNYKGICKCEYDFSKDTPFMKTYNYTLQHNHKQKVNWSAEVKNIEPCKMQNNEFTLSAFGL